MITRNMEAKFKNGRRVVILQINRRTAVVADADTYARHQRNPLQNPLLLEDSMWVPRILFQWTLKRVNLEIQGRQVPLRLTYAVTFNKSQGKHLERTVVDVRCQAFAHGQLYVALSRVRRSADLLILCSAVSVVQQQRLDGAVDELL